MNESLIKRERDDGLPFTDRNPPFSLRELYYMVFRHKMKICVFALAVTVTALFLLLTAPPTYRSSAQVLVRQGRESRTDPLATTGQLPFLHADWENQFKSELAILRSHELARMVAEAVGPQAILNDRYRPREEEPSVLDRLKTALRDLRDRLEHTLHPGEEGETVVIDPAELAAARLADALELEVPEDSNVISLSYVSRDPLLAKNVLKELTVRYLDRHISVHKTAGSYAFFQEQQEQVGAALHRLESRIRNLKNQLGIGSLEARRGMVASRIGELESSIKNTEAEIEAFKAQVASMQEQLLDASPAAGSRGTGQRLLAPKSLFGQEIYNDVQQQILTAQASLAALNAKNARLRDQLTEAHRELKRLNDHESELAQLRRERAVLEAKYRTYSDNLEQARIDQALEKERYANISIVQPATYPLEPVNAHKPAKAILALLFGLFGGLGLAFTAEFFDTTFNRPEEIEAKLGLPTLASLPYVDAGSVTLTTLPARSRGAVQTDVERRYSSTLSHYYEMLRDRLLLALNGTLSQPTMIAVTSSRPGEGVSTVAANLAVTLARQGDQRVLLVDANLEHPGANEIFGVRRGPGVAEILGDGEGNTTTIEQNLYFLSAGEKRGGLPQTIVPQKFETLKRLVNAQQYSFVVFDVPSVNQGTSTARLASLVDGVILVTEAERIRAEVAQRTKELLLDAKANVLGVVLNKRRYYVPNWLYKRF